jgi:hypothetical protein
MFKTASVIPAKPVPAKAGNWNPEKFNTSDE